MKMSPILCSLLNPAFFFIARDGLGEDVGIGLLILPVGFRRVFQTALALDSPGVRRVGDTAVASLSSTLGLRPALILDFLGDSR